MSISVLAQHSAGHELVSDELLANRRDGESLGLLYERHLPAVYRYVSGRVGSREEAEDLTSEVFRHAWASRQTYRGTSSFRAWLFGITRRTLADHYRRGHRAAHLDRAVADSLRDDRPTPEDAVLVDESAREVRALLDLLSLEQQEVLSLRFGAELTYAEIGHVMGKREDAVKKIAYRALDWIRGRTPHA